MLIFCTLARSSGSPGLPILGIKLPRQLLPASSPTPPTPPPTTHWLLNYTLCLLSCILFVDQFQCAYERSSHFGYNPGFDMTVVRLYWRSCSLGSSDCTNFNIAGCSGSPKHDEQSQLCRWASMKARAHMDTKSRRISTHSGTPHQRMVHDCQYQAEFQKN